MENDNRKASASYFLAEADFLHIIISCRWNIPAKISLFCEKHKKQAVKLPVLNDKSYYMSYVKKIKALSFLTVPLLFPPFFRREKILYTPCLP